MDRERHAQVKQVFRDAIRWAPEDRAEVAAALADDGEVRAEVLSLLAHHRDEPLEAAGPVVSGGRTLAEVVRAEDAAAWAPERVVRTLDPVARALAELADGGGVHGAVRADRVTLGEGGGALAGPPLPEDAAPRLDRAAAAAAAPEQLLPSHGPIGPWTDVYALAVLCVELMLGRPATDGAPAAALARARDEAARPTPRALGLAVPGAVEATLAKALATRPMERYQDVRRFWTALRDAVDASRPAQPAAPSPPTPTSIAPGPRRLPWALGAALLALAAAIAAILAR